MSALARVALMVLAVVLAVVLAACGSTAEHVPERSHTSDSDPSPAASVAPPRAATFDARRAPTDQLLEVRERDIDLLRPVSKGHALGEQYEPPDLVTLPPALVAPGYPERRLRVEAADAVARMISAAGSEGLHLRVVSAYRSYEEQVFVHHRLSERRGEAEASRRSAPPGHSEHQLGTTVDLSGLSVDWRLTRQLADAPEGRWLAEHAHRFGFALSCPDGAEAVTGYVYEPWHLRYVGVEHATAWRESRLTLVEYLEALSER